MMTSSTDDPVRQSQLSAHAGCVAGPEQAGAGCVGPTGEESQADAPPPAAGDGAGCAAPAPMGASAAQATPPQSLREFERALRGLGFTRLQAEHIARDGFKANAQAIEAEPDHDRAAILELRDALARSVALLKKA